MLYIDFEGKTVEQATTIGLKELNIKEKDVKVEVINRGKRAIFGLGKKTNAIVRIYYKEKNEIEDLLNSIKIIIGYIDREAQVIVNFKDSDRYYLNIHSKNIAHIIGKRGSHLNSLQTLVNALLQKYENRYKVIINVDKYIQKKDNSFIKWVESQVQLVLKNKKPIVLKPLNSYERRIVHMELKKYKNLVSESKGEGKLKNIKISYMENKIENKKVITE